MPELENQFLDIYGDDFVIKSEQRIESFSPEFPSGQRLDWSYNEKTYALSEELIRNEFLAFTQNLFEEWSNLYESKFKGKFYAMQTIAQDMEPQTATVSALLEQCPMSSKQLKEEISSLKKNYYFAIARISPQVVYQGYPIKRVNTHHCWLLTFYIPTKKWGFVRTNM